MKKNLVTAAATAGLLFTAFGAAANAQEITYTVHPGDSLWKISHLNNVSINQLKAWNQLSGEKIYANQKLSLAYTVKAGDSLWALARANGTTVNELKKLNGLTSDLIRIGQQLRMPNANHISKDSPTATANTIKKSYQTVERSEAAVDSDTDNSQAKAAVSPNSSNPGTQTADSSGTVKGGVAVHSGTVEKPAAASDSTATEKPAAATGSNTAQKQEAASNSTATDKPAAATGSSTAEKPAAVSDSSTAEKPAANSNETQKAAVKSEANVQAIIAEAEKYMGTPYRWGGNTPAGFDCSGFTKYVFNHFGISLPRTTAEQWNATTPVTSPSTGDLVFFQTYKLGPSHVGIYIGGDRFISAASNGVTVSNLTAAYWKTRYLGARSAR